MVYLWVVRDDVSEVTKISQLSLVMIIYFAPCQTRSSSTFPFTSVPRVKIQETATKSLYRIVCTTLISTITKGVPHKQIFLNSSFLLIREKFPHRTTPSQGVCIPTTPRRPQEPEDENLRSYRTLGPYEPHAKIVEIRSWIAELSLEAGGFLFCTLNNAHDVSKTSSGSRHP